MVHNHAIERLFYCSWYVFQVEECGDGVAFCQLLDAVYPGRKALAIIHDAIERPHLVQKKGYTVH